VKDSRAIDFPIDDLDMRRYIHPASPDSSKETITLYSLYAIVVSDISLIFVNIGKFL